MSNLCLQTFRIQWKVKEGQFHKSPMFAICTRQFCVFLAKILSKYFSIQEGGTQPEKARFFNYFLHFPTVQCILAAISSLSNIR